MPRVRILKDMEDDASIGDILNLGKKQAKELVAAGFAELVDATPQKKATFNDSDARVFYRFLGHRPDEFTELRIIKWLPKGSGQVKQEFVQSEEEFIKVIEKWNGKRQCYAGLNPRKAKGGKIEHVARVTAILFDVDSKHPKNQPASDDELTTAKQRMKSLKEWIRLHGYSQPLVAMSGNGFHVIHKVDIEINEDTQSQLEKYHHEAADDLDSMFDIPRIVKVPGTLSIKGAPTEDRPHRLSYIVDKGSASVDTALGKYICSIEVDKTEPLPTVSVEQKSKMTDTFENKRGQTLAYLRRKNKKLDRLLTEETPSGYPSASEADMATLSILLKKGYDDIESVTILRHFRGRKKLDRRNYISKMLEKIHSGDTLKKSRSTKVRDDGLFIAELDHINAIENPAFSGVKVSAQAVVSSTSLAYLAPTKIEATYTVDDLEQTANITIEPDSPVNLKLISVSDDVKVRRMKQLFSGLGKNAQLKELAYRAVYRIRVRPLVFTLEMQGDKIIDDSGQEYKSHDIFITTDHSIAFQAGTLINLTGIPLPSPATQQTTLLVTDVSFPEAIQSFDSEKIYSLRSHLKKKSVRSRINWILKNFEKYSGIISRRSLALSCLLTYFSPIWINLGKDRQRGWVISLMVGDTTTGKSMTMRQIIRLLGAGMLITAETATVVGLIGTTTQVEGRGWFIDWGFIVLCDRGLIAIDGFHKLGSNQTSVMAESERSGIVTIAKAGRASTYARTRQVRMANAVDWSADKRYVTKPLREFLHSALSLDTFMDKTGIARLDIATFADSRDVKAEDINKEQVGRYDKKLGLFCEVLKWVWSERPEIKFTPEAMTLLLKEATNLYNKFYSEIIPLVSIDMKWKLARLSAALATLTLSTEDFRMVTVEKEHVKEMVKFLEKEYTKAGLNTLSEMTRHERLTKEEMLLITDEVARAARLSPEVVTKICIFITNQGRVTKEQLKTKFSLAQKNELNPLVSTLVNEGMLKRGNGFYPTGKMVEYCRLVLEKPEEGTDDTEKPDEEKQGLDSNGFADTEENSDDTDSGAENHRDETQENENGSAQNDSSEDVQKTCRPEKFLPHDAERFAKWLSKFSDWGARGIKDSDIKKEYGKGYLDELAEWESRGWMRQAEGSLIWQITDEGQSVLKGKTAESRESEE